MTRLDEIEARAAAATAGPWRLTYDPEPNEWWSSKGFTDIGPDDEHNAAVAGGGDQTADPDAIFIAAARDDIPWLIAIARAAELVDLLRYQDPNNQWWVAHDTLHEALAGKP